MLTKKKTVYKYRMCLAKQRSYIDQSEARTETIMSIFELSWYSLTIIFRAILSLFLF